VPVISRKVSSRKKVLPEAPTFDSLKCPWEKMYFDYIPQKLNFVLVKQLVVIEALKVKEAFNALIS
jgi:hypothetical protein